MLTVGLLGEVCLAYQNPQQAPRADPTAAFEQPHATFQDLHSDIIHLSSKAKCPEFPAYVVCGS